MMKYNPTSQQPFQSCLLDFCVRITDESNELASAWVSWSVKYNVHVTQLHKPKCSIHFSGISALCTLTVKFLTKVNTFASTAAGNSIRTVELCVVLTRKILDGKLNI